MSSTPEVEIQDMTENSKVISCLKCNITFTRLKSLRKHCQNLHKEEIPLPCNQICGVCHEKFRTLKDLQLHMMSNHKELDIKFEKKVFYSFDDFEQWKLETEKKFLASYILRSTAKKHEVGRTFYTYLCHRSGPVKTYKQKGTTGKVRSTGESVKIGVTCPSIIKVTSNTYNEATEILVEYQPTHVGHSMEIKKLKLPRDFKAHIASLISMGVPYETILDQIQKEYSPTERFGLITRKDLWNIRQSFSIESKVAMNPDDATSLNGIIRKLQDCEDVIIVHKEIGDTLQQYPEIQPEEFLLGVMNAAEQCALEIYGEKCIMFNTMHNINQYGFNLTTIFVNDENKEILPVAIFFSSKAVTENFIPLFEAMKTHLKSNFCVEMIMSDDTDACYDAWKKVFQDDSKHILFPGHVKRNLNNHLYLKVKDAQVKQKMRTDLKNILAEADNATFEILINTFLETYKDEKVFLDYFKEHYVSIKEKWAHCYQIGYEVNENIKLDKWCQEIRYDKASRKIAKRMDESLINVLHGMAQRFISATSEKLYPSLNLIQEMHIMGLTLNENIYSLREVIPNQKWTVIKKNSSSSIENYDVTTLDIKCSCEVTCSNCNICIHSMSCTCVDYSVRFTICKHIHFVSRKRLLHLQESSKNLEVYFDVNLLYDEEIQNPENEKVSKIVNNTSESELEKLKSSLLIRLENIRDSVQKINSMEALEHFNECLKATETNLEMIHTDNMNSYSLPPVPVKRASSKKPASPNKRLKSNKKSNGKNKYL